MRDYHFSFALAAFNLAVALWLFPEPISLFNAFIAGSTCLIGVIEYKERHMKDGAK